MLSIQILSHGLVILAQTTATSNSHSFYLFVKHARHLACFSLYTITFAKTFDVNKPVSIQAIKHLSLLLSQNVACLLVSLGSTHFTSLTKHKIHHGGNIRIPNTLECGNLFTEMRRSTGYYWSVDKEKFVLQNGLLPSHPKKRPRL